jgi:hypothetical protein
MLILNVGNVGTLGNIGTLGLNFAGEGCYSRKSTDSPSLELTKIPPAAQGGRERIVTIEGALETLALDSRSLSMYLVRRGGCSRGRLTSGHDGDRSCRACT